jgi:hypothetical protein
MGIIGHYVQDYIAVNKDAAQFSERVRVMISSVLNSDVARPLSFARSLSPGFQTASPPAGS